MNILVSGGFGFIGSGLTPLLLGNAGRVGVIARRVPDSFRRLATQVECHIHDLSQPIDLRLDTAYDCFVHLAGSLHSATATSADLLTHTVDVTRRCLDVCRVNGISRFVHFSTFQVYGCDHGFIDEDTPVSCRNDYARAHHLAEQEVRRAHEQGIVEYAILRPTNCYGFSAHADVHRWSLVPSCFCRTAVEDGEIVLRTSGLQEKDFIHLDQLASLTGAVCRSFDRFRNQTLNIASGSSCAIIDVATLVKERYERAADRPCALRVLAESPARAEPLVVSQAKTADLANPPSSDQSLDAEIDKTLSFLLS